MYRHDRTNNLRLQEKILRIEDVLIRRHKGRYRQYCPQQVGAVVDVRSCSHNVAGAHSREGTATCVIVAFIRFKSQRNNFNVLFVVEAPGADKVDNMNAFGGINRSQ